MQATVSFSDGAVTGAVIGTVPTETAGVDDGGRKEPHDSAYSSDTGSHQGPGVSISTRGDVLLMTKWAGCPAFGLFYGA